MSIVTRHNPIDLLPDVAVGIKLPFTSAKGNLFDLSYSTEDQLVSNLKNLLLTRRGERIMEPLFGTTLQDSLFEQNVDTLRESISESILSAIQYWLPYITISKLSVTPVIATLGNEEQHGVTISLEVALNNKTANIPINLLVTAKAVEII